MTPFDSLVRVIGELYWASWFLTPEPVLSSPNPGRIVFTGTSLLFVFSTLAWGVTEQLPSNKPPSHEQPTTRPRKDGLDRSIDFSRPTCSVVLPIYSVDPSIWQALLSELLTYGWDEVILCIDEPDPESLSIVEGLDIPTVKTSLSESRRGKGRAIADGFETASGDVIGFIDADGAVPVRDLAHLYDVVIDGEAAVAVGSRDTVPGNRDSQSFHRRILAASYRRFAQYMTGVPATDFQCGAKVICSDAWSDVSGRIEQEGFGFDTALLTHAHGHDYQIKECSVDWDDPGDSTVNVFRDVPRMLMTLMKIRIMLWKGMFEVSTLSPLSVIRKRR